MNKCPKCNGRILLDGTEYTCINCGFVLPDKFTREFVFNSQINKFEERYQRELVSKSLMRHKE